MFFHKHAVLCNVLTNPEAKGVFMLNPRIRVTALGGVADRKNPTGSCLLLEIRHGKQFTRILIDAGAWQGNGDVMRNSLLPPQLDTIDAVVLTHAHNDHAGRLPFFVKHGYHGSVFCTEATADLLGPMLLDTAKIILAEKKDRDRRNSRARKNGNGKKKKACESEPPEFFFSCENVEETLGLIKCGGFKYHRWVKLGKGIFLKFYPSGHVLGGAICVIRVDRNNRPEDSTYLGFSGDLGRSDEIILPPPKVIQEPLNWWFTESTYGGRRHPSRNEELFTLLKTIARTREAGGNVYIPSFSLERTQEIIYLLSRLIANGELAPMTIYLDSPLAEKVTGVFLQYWDTPMFADQNSLDFNPFSEEENPFLKVVLGKEESDNLVNTSEPCIIIAGSGMCDAGRIREHLRYALPNNQNAICLVGYMAEGTLGRRLCERTSSVQMNGNTILVRANIVRFESFSAHADSEFLVDYARRLTIKKGVFLLHGDNENAQRLQQNLQKRLGNVTVFIPKLNEVIDLA